MLNPMNGGTGAGLLVLLHPRGQARTFAGALAAGLLGGWIAVTRLGAPRPDVQFWWNLGEVALLVPAARGAPARWAGRP